jgi:uncharacterized membrane protein YqhA
MRTTELEQLKRRIVGVVVILLGISFLSGAVTEKTGWEVAALGGGVAVAMVALSLVLRLSGEEGSAHRGAPAIMAVP